MSYPCKKCERVFGSDLGLRIHEARARGQAEVRAPDPGVVERLAAIEAKLDALIEGLVSDE